MRPKCVLAVRPDKLVTICAWCADKKQGEDWAETRGYETTHGICATCKEREFPAPKRKG
jgi:hypothetical protein